MLRMTATDMGGNTAALAVLREKRAASVQDLSEDEHQDLLELEREVAEQNHAKAAARCIVAYLTQVVEDGGMFGKGGNSFRHTAQLHPWQDRLQAVVTLVQDAAWVDGQLTAQHVKPRHWNLAKAHLRTLTIRMIEREVGRGY